MPIKTINVLLMLLLASGIKGQIGNYCWIGDFTKICYEFKEDNTFESIELMCTGIIQGTGRFEIKANKIRFIYEPMAFFDNQFLIEKTKENQDSIRIQFLVKDYDTKEEIINYVVSEEKRGQIEQQITLTNDRMEISDKGTPIFLNVYHPDYSSYTFEIKESGDYSVEIFLKYGKEADIYEQRVGEEAFIITHFKENKITLRNEEYDYEITLIKEE